MAYYKTRINGTRNNGTRNTRGTPEQWRNTDGTTENWRDSGTLAGQSEYHRKSGTREQEFFANTFFSIILPSTLMVIFSLPLIRR